MVGRRCVCLWVSFTSHFFPGRRKIPPVQRLVFYCCRSSDFHLQFLAKTFNAAIIFDNNFDAGGFDRVPSLARPRCQHFEHLADEGKTPGPLLILDEEKKKVFIPMHLIDDNTIDRYVQQITNRFELRDSTVVIV